MRACVVAADPGPIQAVLGDRFGISRQELGRWRYLSTGNTTWGVIEHERLEEMLDGLQIERTGMPLLRRVGRFYKPTTVALQVMGPHITRNRIELSREQLETLLSQGPQECTMTGMTTGYVALAGPDGVVGCGLYLEPRPEHDRPLGRLESLLPRVRWSGLELT